MIRAKIVLAEVQEHTHHCDECEEFMQFIPFTVSAGYGSLAYDGDPDLEFCSGNCLEKGVIKMAAKEREAAERNKM